MSEAWADSVESEAYEAFGEGAYDSEAVGEGAYDSEASGEASYEGLGEESGSARRQRERQRQIMLARQRQAQLRRQRQPPARVRRAAPPAGATPPQTIRAIRSLDLETKVGQDSLRRALEESNRRATRATWAAVASAAVDQGLDSFSTDLGNHEYIKAGARFAPLLFLSPAKTRSGVEGFVTDPRVIGGAAILGIALLGNFRSKTPAVAAVNITPPPTANLVAPASGNLTPSTPFTAEALDRNGNPVQPPPAFIWSSDSSALSFGSPTSGSYTLTTGSTGKVTVTVRAAGVSGSLKVKVTAA
jgi:hypothetical protein